MNVRIVEGGTWYTATVPQLPRIAGYGKTPREAETRLRAEIAALEVNLQDELDRIRAVRAAWADQDGGT